MRGIAEVGKLVPDSFYDVSIRSIKCVPESCLQVSNASSLRGMADDFVHQTSWNQPV